MVLAGIDGLVVGVVANTGASSAGVNSMSYSMSYASMSDVLNVLRKTGILKKGL